MKLQIPNLSKTCRIVATRLLAGRTFVHVLGKTPPWRELEPVEAHQGHVFFCTVAAKVGRSSARRALEVAR